MIFLLLNNSANQARRASLVRKKQSHEGHLKMSEDVSLEGLLGKLGRGKLALAHWADFQVANSNFGGSTSGLGHHGSCNLADSASIGNSRRRFFRTDLWRRFRGRGWCDIHFNAVEIEVEKWRNRFKKYFKKLAVAGKVEDAT